MTFLFLALLSLAIALVGEQLSPYTRRRKRYEKAMVDAIGRNFDSVGTRVQQTGDSKSRMAV